MTKSKILVGVFISALLGCEQQPPSNNDAKTTATTPNQHVDTKLAQFEVRDFKLDVKNDSNTATYKGRGTLYSKDDPVRAGNYMVWLQAKRSHKNDETWSTLVDIRDGIGTFQTFDYIQGQSASNKPDVQYSDWSVAGYIRLTSAQLASNELAKNAASSTSSQPPQFEIRDFRIVEDGNKYFPTANGHGLLVAKTSDLKTGRYIVWLESKRAHENDDRWLTAVELQDGIGGFDTRDFLWELKKKNMSVKYYDWRVFGYTKCQTGAVIIDGINKDKQTNNSPIIELRDFSSVESPEEGTSGTWLTSHATAVAKTESLKQGTNAVWLRGKAAHSNDNQRTFMITLRDGLGTLKIQDYLPNREKENTKVKYTGWEAFCIAPMTPADMASNPRRSN